LDYNNKKEGCAQGLSQPNTWGNERAHNTREETGGFSFGLGGQGTNTDA